MAEYPTTQAAACGHKASAEISGRTDGRIRQGDLHSWEGIARVRADCEAQAAREGLAGLELFFRSQNLFTEALNQGPTYREKSAAFVARCKTQPRAEDPAIAALREIAAGHNDARGLALEVLSQTTQQEQGKRTPGSGQHPPQG